MKQRMNESDVGVFVAVALMIAIAFFPLSGAFSQEDDGVSLGKIITNPPVLKSAISSPLDSANIGMQYVISTSMRNVQDSDLKFLTLIEVRNSERVTEYLTWQSGMIESGNTLELGSSWVPEHADTYLLRAFVISGFDQPIEILSVVRQSEITIIEQ